VSSQLWLDVTGEVDLGGGYPPSYASVIQNPCLECSAASWELCVNPKTGLPRKAPCIRRFQRN
jgi:hypothetical protein